MKAHASHFTYCLLLSIAIILTSCGDDDVTPPSETGIEGRVWTQNEFGQPLYEERSGISVFLETGFRTFNIEGDQVGRYRLTGAPVGTYTARFSKPGFGTVVRSGIRVNTRTPALEVIQGFQQFPSVTITKLPNTSFSNLTASTSENEPYVLTVTGNLVPPPPPTGQAKGYRIFVGTNSEVSKDDFVFQKHLTSTTASFSDIFENELFSQLPGASGSVFFVRLYGDSNFDESYTDQTGKEIFPNLTTTPSQVLSLVLP